MGSGEPYVVIFFQKLGGTLAADPRVIGNLGGISLSDAHLRHGSVRH